MLTKQFLRGLKWRNNCTFGYRQEHTTECTLEVQRRHMVSTLLLWEDFNAVWIITILLGLRNVRWITELVEPSACLAINKFLSQRNHKSTLCSFSCRVCHFCSRYWSLCVNWQTIRSLAEDEEPIDCLDTSTQKVLTRGTLTLAGQLCTMPWSCLQ